MGPENRIPLGHVNISVLWKYLVRKGTEQSHIMCTILSDMLLVNNIFPQIVAIKVQHFHDIGISAFGV